MRLKAMLKQKQFFQHTPDPVNRVTGALSERKSSTFDVGGADVRIARRRAGLLTSRPKTWTW